MKENRKPIAIAGASGFVGTNLHSYLEEKGGIVTPVSLFDQSWPEQLAMADVVVNLVGKAHDHKGTATEKEYFDVNLNLTKKIFKHFINGGSKLLIHISSLAAVEEYSATKPLMESAHCNPVSWYGKSKRAAEKWLLKQDVPSNKKVVILRPPMIHGKGDKGNLRLLYNIINKGIPYPLTAFENKRSFLSIENCSFFIDQIIKNYPKMESGIYHIADDEMVSTNEIIKLIQKVTNKNGIQLRLPKGLVKSMAKMGDVLHLPLNSKRLKKMTGNLTVSNYKIKNAIGVESLPVSATTGLLTTLKSFNQQK